MDPVTFEQIAADKTAMGDAAKWLKTIQMKNVLSCVVEWRTFNSKPTKLCSIKIC